MIIQKLTCFLILIIGSLSIFAQNTAAIEKSIENNLDIQYYKGIDIDSEKNITLYFSVNPNDLEERTFNLRDMNILGVERSEKEKYGRPLGEFRVLLQCKSENCILVKQYEIDGDKKLLSSRSKNTLFWIYFNDYNNAQKVEGLFKKLE